MDATEYPEFEKKSLEKSYMYQTHFQVNPTIHLFSALDFKCRVDT